jgi:carboxypeptidase Q
MRSILLSVLSLIVVAGSSVAATAITASDYEDATGRIIGAALLSNDAYESLAYLCDRFGHRLSGSETLERAIDWSVAEMAAAGLENAHKEEVMVPAWIRGKESARVLEPAAHELSLLGLGRSIGTNGQPLRAELVVVGSFDELTELGAEEVSGKIVLYDVPYTDYGETVQFRGKGASEAARLGAVAALVRSVGPISYDTPHTGALRYDEELPKIPSAAITIENSTMLRRMQERGERIVVELNMEAHMADDRLSHNAIAEIRGRERPDEIVVIGGHIDSWDVGQGAQDDGTGCVLAMQAARLLERLNLRPRRTVRVVLFTNEENGLRGGEQYRDDHRDELERHVAAIETDTGNGLASGFRVDVRTDPLEGDDATVEARQQELLSGVLAQLEPLRALLKPLDADTFIPAFSGADVMPIAKEGVLCFGMNHDTSHYFDIHHTEADTFDKIEKADLDQNVAILAVMTYLLAEMPDRLLPWPDQQSR